MKKGQIFEGVIERVDFPNKGIIYIREEDRYVTVKKRDFGAESPFCHQ